MGLSENFRDEDDHYWQRFFTFTMWYLWRIRNQKVFQAGDIYQGDPVLAIKRLVRENEIANNLRLKISERSESGGDTKWQRPPKRWIKLNVDGAVSRSTQQAAIGGILRDERGNWIKGFSKFIGVCNIATAELWAILQRMKLAKELKIEKLIVKSDAVEIIQAIEEEIRNNALESGNQLLLEIIILARGEWEVRFQSIPCEANKCADFLAREALSHYPLLRILEMPERELQMLFYADYKLVN